MCLLDRGEPAEYLGQLRVGLAFGQRRIRRLDARVALELTRGHRGAHAEAAPIVGRQHAQLRDAGQVDHARRLGEAVLHLRQQVGAAGQKLRLPVAGAEQLQALIETVGRRKVESSHAGIDTSEAFPVIERPTGYTVKTVIMSAMSSTDSAAHDLTWDERIFRLVDAGVDGTLIAENLRRTPTERLRRMQDMARFLEDARRDRRPATP